MSVQRQLGLSEAADIVHSVTAIPGERDGGVIATTGEGSGETSQGELAESGREEDVGRLDVLTRHFTRSKFC